jgi:flagellar biosynthesis protein FliQ
VSLAGTPDLPSLVSLAQQSLLLAVAVSLPVVAALALASLVTSVVQAATHVADSTLAHLPRFLVAVIVLAVFGRWMGSEIAAFAVRVFSGNA